MDKFKLSNESMIDHGITLYRIVALTSFSDVRQGRVGGWVESESNLSQLGNCWIYENAKVYGAATVTGDAQVKGNARVLQNAIVEESAIIMDECLVFGNGRVGGQVTMEGNAVVKRDAQASGQVSIQGNALLRGNARVVGIGSGVVIKDQAIIYADGVIAGNNIIVEGETSIDGYATVTPTIIDGYPGGPIVITDTHMRLGCCIRPITTWVEFHNVWIVNKAIIRDDFIAIVGREPEGDELEFEWWVDNGASTIQSALEHAASVVM